MCPSGYAERASFALIGTPRSEVHISKPARIDRVGANAGLTSSSIRTCRLRDRLGMLRAAAAMPKAAFRTA